MKLPEPIGCIAPLPHFDMPPIHGEGIIPPVTVPAKVTGFPIAADMLTEPSPVGQMIAELMAKITLEDARIRRLLPALPVGYSWRGDLEWRETLDFTRYGGELTARLVYRVHDADGQRLDEVHGFPAWVER